MSLNETAKTTENSGKKAIFMSGLSLAVILMLLGYSAYGWFSIAKDVKAQGMELTVQATSGLEISLDPTNPDGWSESVSVDMDDFVTISGFTKGTDDFYLVPASSYTGFDNQMYTTKSINGFIEDDGDWSQAEVTTAFAQHYDNSDHEYQGNYIDVPLYFRYNVGKTAFDLYLNKNNTAIVPFVSGDEKIANTVRVAFLKFDDQTKNSMGQTPAVGSAQYVYSNRTTARSVISGMTGSSVSLQAPNFLTFDAGTNLSEQTLLQGTAGDETNYASMMVRIWVEGQDADCVDEIGRQAFSVSLGFHGEPQN